MFILKQRMCFFAALAINNFETAGFRNSRVEELIYYCKFWANEFMKRKPEDKDAKKFIDFPNSYPIK